MSESLGERVTRNNVVIILSKFCAESSSERILKIDYEVTNTSTVSCFLDSQCIFDIHVTTSWNTTARLQIPPFFLVT